MNASNDHPSLDLEIARGAHVVVRATARPYNAGSVDLDLGRAVEAFASLTDGELDELSEWIARVEAAMEALYRPEGMNVGCVVGEGLGPTRVQLVPRWIGDTNFMITVAGAKVLPEDLSETAARYRKVLGVERGEVS